MTEHCAGRPRVSVMTRNYNQGRVVAQALAAIGQQRTLSFKVEMIDDVRRTTGSHRLVSLGARVQDTVPPVGLGTRSGRRNGAPQRIFLESYCDNSRKCYWS